MVKGRMSYAFIGTAFKKHTTEVISELSSAPFSKLLFYLRRQLTEKKVSISL